jgi:phosphoglycolate phosphatase
MSHQIRLIVFDLDGTLADSLPDIALAANYACRALGAPERSTEALKAMIGGGERKFVARFLGPGREALQEEALKLYLEHYRRHCGDLTRLYPGVAETLPRLGGKKLAVLSNKRQDLTEEVLRVLGVGKFFAAVQGGGEELALKPSPEPLLALIRKMGEEPGHTLMVGDKPADVLAGKGAGTLTCGLTCGYGEPGAVAAAGPDFLIHSFPEVVNIMADI